MADNIILLTIDCLRYDRCGFNGYCRDTTPTLDRLASDSYVFDEAYAPGPRTAESVPGFLSGYLSAECPFVDIPSYTAIPSDAETLATWLSDTGYETNALLANPQLSSKRNFDRGFDTFKNIRTDRSGTDSVDDDGGGRELQIKNALEKLDFLPIDPVRIGYTGHKLSQLRSGSWPTVDGADVIDAAIDQLDPERGPQFVWSHLNDVHTPLHPGRATEGGLISGNSASLIYGEGGRINHERAPVYEQMYDSTIRYVDGQIKRLLEYLEESGMAQNTVVVVTADHGEAMLERGLYEHAAGRFQRYTYDDRDYLHSELLHVPLLVHTPGDDSARISKTASLLRLPDILAEAANLPYGDFPRTDPDSPYLSPAGPDSEYVAVSDTITENGHTVTLRTDNGTLYTDGTAASASDSTSDDWWFFAPGDRMERFSRPAGQAPERHRERCREIMTHPDSLSSLSEEIDTETMDMLADLGYK